MDRNSGTELLKDRLRVQSRKLNTLWFIVICFVSASNAIRGKTFHSPFLSILTFPPFDIPELESLFRRVLPASPTASFERPFHM